jgi:uncharacterized protein with PhoU and TrkA domain
MATMRERFNKRIEAAKDWGDLEDVIKDTQVAFEGERLSGAAAEDIAEKVRRRAREIPE